MKNNVQVLTEADWSSKVDRVFLPDANDYNKKTYLNRYMLVLEKVLRFHRGSTVIDCACGDGSGSAFLAEQCPGWNILGVDLNAEMIDFACDRYATKFNNLSYAAKSIIDIEEETDIFVCLETIEHIDRELMIRVLNKIADKLLKKGGKLVISTPRLRPRESTVKRPGHINELYYQEFKYILGDLFPMLEFYGLDRYANLVPDSSDNNCVVAICSTWPTTSIF